MYNFTWFHFSSMPNIGFRRESRYDCVKNGIFDTNGFGGLGLETKPFVAFCYFLYLHLSVTVVRFD